MFRPTVNDFLSVYVSIFNFSSFVEKVINWLIIFIMHTCIHSIEINSINLQNFTQMHVVWNLPHSGSNALVPSTRSTTWLSKILNSCWSVVHWMYICWDGFATADLPRWFRDRSTFSYIQVDRHSVTLFELWNAVVDCVIWQLGSSHIHSSRQQINISRYVMAVLNCFHFPGF